MIDKNKGGSTLPGAIYVLGALAAVLIIALIAREYTGRITHPSPEKVYINGSKDKVVSSLAGEVDKCWEKYDYGAEDIQRDDCILIKVKSSESISNKTLKDHLSYDSLKRNFKSVNIPKNEKIMIKITYKGDKGIIEVREF